MKELKEAEVEAEHQIRDSIHKHQGVVQGELPTKPTYAIFNFLVWGVIYGYFALRYDDDPENCFAVGGRLTPTTDNKSGQAQNAGVRFRNCFEILFFVCLLQIVMVTTMQVVYGTEYLKRALSILTLFAQYAYGLVWIYLIIVRFSHSGKVCSGDYLAENDITEGYTVEQGRFIKIIFYIFLYMMAFVACCGCCALMFYATKKT